MALLCDLCVRPYGLWYDAKSTVHLCSQKTNPVGMLKPLYLVIANKVQLSLSFSRLNNYLKTYPVALADGVCVHEAACLMTYLQMRHEVPRGAGGTSLPG